MIVRPPKAKVELVAGEEYKPALELLGEELVVLEELEEDLEVFDVLDEE